MANNYTEFSEALEFDELQWEEQVQWLKEQLEDVYGYWKNPDATAEGMVYFSTQSPVPEAYAFDDAVYHGPRFLTDHPDVDPYVAKDPDRGFSYTLEESHIVLYAEENGDPGKVVWLVRKFLDRFDRHGAWSMAYCCRCDKPRIGEFGGGSVVVTAQTAQWFDASAAAMDRIKELQQPRLMVAVVLDENLNWLSPAHVMATTTREARDMAAKMWRDDSGYDIDVKTYHIAVFVPEPASRDHPYDETW